MPLFALFVSSLALAGPDAGVKPDSSASASKTVMTYYGLRKYELEPEVEDEAKLREWQAFIERTKEQVEYAKGAVERWKNAARVRVLEQVRADDQNGALTPEEKMKSWERVNSLYPNSPDARTAQKRVGYWRAEEIKRRVEGAEEVERAKGSKAERIRAWRLVSNWAPGAAEGRAADKRIDALEQQLFAEAESLDKIQRVDPKTKLEAWRELLSVEPRAAFKKTAEKRVTELEAQAGANP
jgi:hypothetical protein